jgi:hypothetical protein
MLLEGAATCIRGCEIIVLPHVVKDSAFSLQSFRFLKVQMFYKRPMTFPELLVDPGSFHDVTHGVVAS